MMQKISELSTMMQPSLALLYKAMALLGSESHSQLESTQARSEIQNFYAEG